MISRFLTNPLMRLGLAMLVAFTLLWIYSRQKVDAENAALGEENHAAFEIWNGRRFTAPRPQEIVDLVGGVVASPPRVGALPATTILWLGNSQLHTINQYRSGEHLAPYWLAETAGCGGCLLPLGISLPNANLQEQLVLTQYVLSRIPVKLVVLKLVFDDLREDGLRLELEPMLDTAVRRALSESPAGREILENWNERHTQGDTGEKKPSGLEGFAQRHLEERLDTLFSVFPIWAERGAMRSRLMLDLYLLRNWAFGISPSSVRRMIPARYDRNRRAFDAIVAATRRAGVPLIVYIAPIRSDMAIPYDIDAYRRFIGEIEAKAASDGFAFLDLQSLVPNDQWGSYVAENVDFMHFQGNGHKLLAGALLPYVDKLTGLGLDRKAASEMIRQ